MPGVATASLLPEPAPRRQDEFALLATVMSYLGWALPVDAIAHHSPGEGKRTKRAQGELRRSGYVTGWPDVEVCYQGRVIFIELKAARGTLSTAQRNTHRRLTYCGATVLCCRSLPCVEESLRELGVPLESLGGGMTLMRAIRWTLTTWAIAAVGTAWIVAALGNGVVR